MTVEREEVAAALRGFPRMTLDRPGVKRAGVAITLTLEDDGPAFLLTRRASTLRGHAGQWALPGGRAEPGETPGQTARRELAEGLGRERGREAKLVRTYNSPTRSGYVITPVVLWAGADVTLVPNPAEVGELHRIPLAT